MAALSGPLFAAAALLALAGVGKVASPATTRVALRQASLPSSTIVARGLGAIEIAIGVATIALGGRLAATAIAATYLGFAWFARRLQRATRGSADCGCFGASSAPVGPIHVGVNLAIAALALGAAAFPTAGIASAFDDTPWHGVPFVALTALLTWMTYVALTALPAALAAANEAPAAPSYGATVQRAGR